MKCIKIQVKGIVQGVGFRPFVYKLALDNSLFGWVNNDDRGVNIVLEGDNFSIEKFITCLKNSPPPLAKIDSIETQNLEIQNFYSFEIVKSVSTSNKLTMISPDIAICDDCIADIKDKTNFRFNYALTNCTNCGPRYSIIDKVPYDRCNTSMAKFSMCDKCESEYKNPLDRRYHAQPISCENCGPKIALYDKQNSLLVEDYEAIAELAEYIKDGFIVAIKGMGGFHIVCDATNTKSIELLRQRKNRPTKPFAVMFKDIKQLKKYARVTKKEEEIILSKEKPIVLGKTNFKLSANIAPNIHRLGCFIAYTPLHLLLFENLDNPIVATSANLSGEPIIRFKDEIISKLSGVVDFILDFDRDIINACDDSVVQLINNDLQVLRNARGYAPKSIKMHKKIDKKILALGANQKSTIALAFDDNLILSPHIGDLDSITSVEYFERTIDTFKRFYDFKPDIIVCDKHPNYESTKWAKNQGIELVQIQHHYAHMLSCMAEYKLEEKVLAFCFDGTGFGDDGNIWGGEVFLGDKNSYERIYHFDYFKLLGSSLAIKEPRRVALSFLFENFTLDEVLNLDNASVKSFNENEIKIMYQVWTKSLNSPLTSSCGRIFDAISSLSDICHYQSYEGESGLMMEKVYNGDIKEYYDYKITDSKIYFKNAIKDIVKDKKSDIIVSKFINTLVNIIKDISNEYKNLPIVLSGGVFQNKTLLELILKELKNRKVYSNKTIPLNDGGIALGQLYSLI